MNRGAKFFSLYNIHNDACDLNMNFNNKCECGLFFISKTEQRQQKREHNCATRSDIRWPFGSCNQPIHCGNPENTHTLSAVIWLAVCAVCTRGDLMEFILYLLSLSTTLFTVDAWCTEVDFLNWMNTSTASKKATRWNVGQMYVRKIKLTWMNVPLAGTSVKHKNTQNMHSKSRYKLILCFCHSPSSGPIKLYLYFIGQD